jgi:undecaprenyl-phosphate galactose phosphotransferase/putative colanic acid biosynthesis UDP-glucose lipid carrier transferase
MSKKKLRKGKSKFTPLLFASIDIILIITSFFLANQVVFDGISPNIIFYSSSALVVSFIWVILSLKFNLYEIPRIIYTYKVLSENIYALFNFSLLIGGILFFSTNTNFSKVFLVFVLLFFFLGLLFWRFLAMYVIKTYRKQGNNYRSILLVGLNKNIATLIDEIYLKPKYGYKIAGLFTDANVKNNIKELYKGGLSEIKFFLDNNYVDEIIISLPHHAGELINDLFRYADNNMIRVRVIPEFSEYLSQTFSIDYVQNIPILKLRSEPLNSITNRTLKRCFDILFSLISALFIFTWLFPIIAIIIKLTSNGPVFFVQKRTGKDGIAFNCFKFRSMSVNSNSDNLQATKNDTRVTDFGAFMRKTSIDELPQIINVLLNQMSLVGPRPHMLKHTDEYRILVDKFMVRHFAKPGVTGWAQINGFRGETKLLKDMENRAAADIWYIENWSFFLDIKIVISTAWSMFFKKDENAF